jgi:hypothetical protein
MMQFSFHGSVTCSLLGASNSSALFSQIPLISFHLSERPKFWIHTKHKEIIVVYNLILNSYSVLLGFCTFSIVG